MTPEERQVQKVSPKLWEDIRRQRIAETFKLDPVVEIKLKGTTYKLEYNNYAMKGVLKDTLFNAMNGLDADAIRDPVILGAMLYWGLKTHHPVLEQDDVDKLYTYRHYSYVTGKIVEACTLFQADMSDYELDLPPIKESPADPIRPSAIGG